MMRMMFAIATCVAVCSPAGAQVELRNDEPAPPGEAVAVDEHGVTFRHEDGQAETIVSWDRVRTVSGELAGEAADHADFADRLWRARTRIERGDWRLGEPLFERLFPTYGTLTGPSSAVVAEGLLRCRLRRGAQAAAVEPWLALVRIRRAEMRASASEAGSDAEPGPRRWLGGQIDLAPVLDSAMLLAPALPPVWLPGPAVEAMTDSPGVAISGVGDDVALQLAEWYHVAAAFESGREVTLPNPSTTHPGAGLVIEMVTARAGDPAQRQNAREAMQARLSTTPAAWIQVWCHVGIGRSYLREPDEAMQRRGVLHLLHVPASYGSEHPYLAGVALAESAVALAASGNHDSAARIRAELERSYSDHPALAWPPLRRTSQPALPGPPAAEPGTPDPIPSPDSKGAA